MSKRRLIEMVKTVDHAGMTSASVTSSSSRTRCTRSISKSSRRRSPEAFVFSFEEQAESLFQSYLDHAEAYVNKTQGQGLETQARSWSPTRSFLKSVEEQIAIVGTRLAMASARRSWLTCGHAHVAGRLRSTHRSYEPLKEAIEKRLMSSVRDMSRIVTKSRTRDEEQRRKYDDLIKGLLERGYNEHSAEMVLKYAANNLWKD